MNDPTPALHVAGATLADAANRPVRLRGFGLGGWMSMENFISGYAATEEVQRRAMRQVMAPDAYEAFFDRYLDCFFTDQDAAYVASLGLNCVRIAINYRHFDSDDQPGTFIESGFARLDRAIADCARHGLYTVIDLHAVPGAQNQRWHSDNPTHVALLWQYREFQDRVVHLWQKLADRYRGNGWVAGYNLLNEPGDPSGQQLAPFYQRLRDAIRAIDPDHVLFLDGNRQGTAFEMFAEPWDNTVYSVHDYALAGFFDSGDYPGMSRGQWVDQAQLRQKFLERSEYSRRSGTPLWIGEFGPMYSGERARDNQRYAVLADQLGLYDEFDAGWSLWTYKDIGLQGIRHTAPDSSYMKLIDPVVQKKARLGVDAWGSSDAGLRDLLEPIDRRLADEFPGFNPPPFGRTSLVHTLIRHILFAEPLAAEFAQLFAGVSVEQAQGLAGCFAFDQTLERTRLAEMMVQTTSRTKD